MGHPWLPPRVAGGCHPFPSRAGGGRGVTTAVGMGAEEPQPVLVSPSQADVPIPCWCPHPRLMFLHEVDTTL